MAQSAALFFPFPLDTHTACIPGSLGLCFLTFKVTDEAKQVPARRPVTLDLHLALLTPECRKVCPSDLLARIPSTSQNSGNSTRNVPATAADPVRRNTLPGASDTSPWFLRSRPDRGTRLAMRGKQSHPQKRRSHGTGCGTS